MLIVDNDHVCSSVFRHGQSLIKTTNKVSVSGSSKVRDKVAVGWSMHAAEGTMEDMMDVL